MKDYKIFFDKIEWQEKVPGVKFKELIIENKKIRLVEFTDELVEKDWCTNGHLGFVIDGSVNVTFFNGHRVVFEKGDFINIPKGEQDKHKTEITRGERALVIFVEVFLNL